MLSYFKSIPQHLINPIISSTAVIVGALIGAVCSYFITKSSTLKSLQCQERLVLENRRFEEKRSMEKLLNNSKIIQLDICTALFQSIRAIKNYNKNNYDNIIPIPYNREYPALIASLDEIFDLKEMSYIYQLYGVIEIVNKNISEEKDKSLYYYNMMLKKVYGENYAKILEIDIEKAQYESLYNNSLIKEGYKAVLKKLNLICNGNKKEPSSFFKALLGD